MHIIHTTEKKKQDSFDSYCAVPFRSFVWCFFSRLCHWCSDSTNWAFPAELCDCVVCANWVSWCCMLLLLSTLSSVPLGRFLEFWHLCSCVVVLSMRFRLFIVLLIDLFRFHLYHLFISCTIISFNCSFTYFSFIYSFVLRVITCHFILFVVVFVLIIWFVHMSFSFCLSIFVFYFFLSIIHFIFHFFI